MDSNPKTIMGWFMGKSGMSNRGLYILLRKKTPPETREYVKKVTETMPIDDFGT